jgi:hypothetical protein
VYPALLLILGFLYGMSVFKIRRNYNEGRWVLCSTLLIIPVFAAAALVYYFAPDQYQVTIVKELHEGKSTETYFISASVFLSKTG